MKFGLGPYCVGGAGGEELLAQASAAEQHAFDSVWVEERQATRGDPVAAAPVAAAAAVRTTAVRIGVMPVLGLVNPVYVAEDIAVLDCLSGGRVLFAPARPLAAEMRARRLDRDSAGARFAESLEVVWRSWSPVPFRHDGPHYRIPGRIAANTECVGIDQVSVTPKPAQAIVPTWLPLATAQDAQLAHRFGLPVIGTAAQTAAELAPLLALARGERGGNGARPLTALVRDVFVDADNEQAWRVARPGLEALYARYRAEGLIAGGGRALDLASERAVIGSVDHCIEQIAGYRDELAVDYLICRIALPGIEPARAGEAIEFFGQAVISEFRMTGFPPELRMRAPIAR
jgi:alkanesulfonate monooxygenase SsuD/methylene tetrahydromethanopterin reductase-like flavin-dependent oxidoreductase (luciferase family)